MFKNDKPIESDSEDLLSRTEFASTLASALISYKDNSPLTIGLYGPWGSGKTSLVNLIINKVNGKAEVLTREEKPVILRFDPWNFESTDQLIHQFFIRLADLLLSSADKELAKVGNLLRDYDDDFQFIPVIGKSIGHMPKFIGTLLQKCTVHGVEINKQREQIIKKLKNQNHRNIITIDNIDRLTNDEIQLIFKLVSSVFNFPNIIFCCLLIKK